MTDANRNALRSFIAASSWLLNDDDAQDVGTVLALAAEGLSALMPGNDRALFDALQAHLDIVGMVETHTASEAPECAPCLGWDVFQHGPDADTIEIERCDECDGAQGAIADDHAAECAALRWAVDAPRGTKRTRVLRAVAKGAAEWGQPTVCANCGRTECTGDCAGGHP